MIKLLFKILSVLLTVQVYAQNIENSITLESKIYTEGDELRLKDNYLFINDVIEIKVYDLNSLGLPVLIKTLPLPFFCWDFEIVDRLAFCLSRTGNVQIFNISNCEEINLISEINYDTIGETIRIKIIGNTILILEQQTQVSAGIEYYYSLDIINIDDILKPKWFSDLVRLQLYGN